MENFFQHGGLISNAARLKKTARPNRLPFIREIISEKIACIGSTNCFNVRRRSVQCCSPPLLIEAHRGIELQATDGDYISFLVSPHLVSPPFLPFPPSFLSLCLSPSATSAHPFSVPFCRLFPLSLSLFLLPRSVSFCVFGPELSEFHFRPITIHPRFKAAVTPRSFRKRAAARSNHFFSPHFTSPLAFSARSHFAFRFLLTVC